MLDHFAFGDIPIRGLREVLTSWALAGEVHEADALIQALGQVDGEATVERAWGEEAARQRSNRVLWSLLEADMLALPTEAATWTDALPATSRSERTISQEYARPVDWPATLRLNQGWPGPRGWAGARFVGRRRQREQDTVLVRVAAWTVHQLIELRRDAIDPSPSAAGRMAALELAAGHLPHVDAIDRSEVAAASRSGPPWNLLTPLTERLLELHDDPVRFAHDVVLPDDELRWRLFHLAVFGEVLSAFSRAGHLIVSHSPLSGSSRRPSHVASNGPLGRIDLWFEASNAWKYYGGPGELAYHKATSSARYSPGELSPDCLSVWVDPHGAPVLAVALECKYSPSNPDYVVRAGYVQALGYAVELRRTLRCPVAVFVVGPRQVVGGVSEFEVLPADGVLGAARVGLADPDSMDVVHGLRPPRAAAPASAR